MRKNIIFAVIIIVLCMTGCIDKTEVVITEEEAVKICEELFSKADGIYSIFYSGLPTEADTIEMKLPIENEKEKFYPVISDEYQSIAEIKKYIESVFTYKFAEENFYTYFEESKDDTELSMPLYKEVDGVLCKNVNNGGKGWGILYHPESLKILNQDKNTLVLEMETTLFDEPNEKSIVTLQKNNGKWLLNSPIH